MSYSALFLVLLYFWLIGHWFSRVVMCLVLGTPGLLFSSPLPPWPTTSLTRRWASVRGYLGHRRLGDRQHSYLVTGGTRRGCCLRQRDCVTNHTQNRSSGMSLCRRLD